MSTSKNVCDETVFREVYRLHGKSLSNVLYYQFGDLEKSKDFIQEALIKLWENCKKVSFEKTRSYLYSVAKRLFLDDYDHEQVKLRFREKTLSISRDKTEMNPEFNMLESEFKEKLEQSIEALPEKQRMVFLMNRIDQMPYKEIAETLDLNIKTVEKHISAALKNLKGNIEELKNIKI
ncbi:MAG: sigma-70 family RNA polymerase sigma factor [Bacteroidota bacterium]